MKRIFIAIDPPSKPERVIDQLKKTLTSGFKRLRFVRPNQYHITIAFIQAADDAMIGKAYAATESVCDRHEAITVEIGGYLGFPSLNSCRTLALAVKCDPLVKLASELTGELAARKAKIDRKAYAPHLSVARVRGAGGLNLEQLSHQAPPQFDRYTVAELKIYESVPTDHGFVHQTLKVFKLMP